MSGSSRSSRPPGLWQPGHDYWIYLPDNASDFLAARRTRNLGVQTRHPWLFVEDRRTSQEPYHDLARIPQASPVRPSIPVLLMDPPDTPPTYYQPWTNLASATEEESKLSPEEQKQAVSKLRKQLYNPHINNIIKRLGSKYPTSTNPGASYAEDELKRCAVCLEDFETKQFVTTTPCGHMFHEECIVPWVKSQGKCPVCRSMIVEKSPPQPSRNDGISRLGR